MKVKVKLTFRSNDKTINTIATNSKEMGQLITESLRKEKQALSDNKKNTKIRKKKLNIETFWRNTINTRRQVPWQHHKAKGRTYKMFSSLLPMDPQRMPRNYLQSFVKNENEEELEITHQLATEQFKSEINLQKKCSEKYQASFRKIDTDMIT